LLKHPVKVHELSRKAPNLPILIIGWVAIIKVSSFIPLDHNCLDYNTCCGAAFIKNLFIYLTNIYL
jgi:hypothetical protein